MKARRETARLTPGSAPAPRVIVALALAWAACATPAMAGAGYSRGGAFQTPGFGARAWGMAGSAIAGVGDETAVYWNPAALSRLNSTSFAGGLSRPVSGLLSSSIRESQAIYARVFARSDTDMVRGAVGRHVAGAMFTNLHVSTQEDQAYDENTLRLAYAYSPDFFVSFGFAVDLLFSTSDVQGFDARGTSIDFAGRLDVLENLALGVVVRNAFSRYGYDDGKDFSRERRVDVGLATGAVPNALVEGALYFANGGLRRGSIGAETDYLFDRLSLRAGVGAFAAGESRVAPYFGFGLVFDRLRLDYAAALDDEAAFGTAHRFSLGASL